MTITQLIRDNPGVPAKQLAAQYGIKPQTVNEIRCRLRNVEAYRARKREWQKARDRRNGVRPREIADAERSARCWPAWKLDYLREQWPHQSASAIANHLGTTKNAVIGKAHRLGLPPKRRAELDP